MGAQVRPNTAAPQRGPSVSALRVANRVAAGLLGGYAFTWGFAAMVIAGLVALGSDFHEAETATYLLAFPVFLGMFLWAFSAPRATRVWIVLLGGGLSMTAAAVALQDALLR